jgi:hypothetical protein
MLKLSVKQKSSFDLSFEVHRRANAEREDGKRRPRHVGKIGRRRYRYLGQLWPGIANPATDKLSVPE